MRKDELLKEILVLEGRKRSLESHINSLRDDRILRMVMILCFLFMFVLFYAVAMNIGIMDSFDDEVAQCFGVFKG